MRVSAVFALFAVNGACTPQVQLESSDIRVDGAGEQPVDSVHPRMCVSDAGNVYIAWSDDRTGVPAVWLATSTDRGDTWSEPVRINQGEAAAVAPDLACVTDRDGDTVLDDLVYLVWEDARDGELDNRNVYMQISRDGGRTWLDADRRVSQDPNGMSMHLGPRVVAANREVYVAWFDGGAGAFDILVQGSHDRGESWNDIVRVDGDEPGSAYSAWPDLATDGQGHAYVVWEDSRDGASDIYVAATANGGFSFTNARRLDVGQTVTGDEDLPGAHDSFRPRIAANGPAVFVVWHDERNGPNRDVLMNWSVDFGVTWQFEAARVDTDQAGFFDSINPAVAVVRNSGDGPAFIGQIAWQDARATGYDIFHRRQAPNGSLQDPEVRLDTDAAGTGNSLNVEIATEGEVVVVAWEDRRDDTDGAGYNEIYYTFSLDGGATWWEDELRIDSLKAGTSYKTDLSLHLLDGEIYASWIDGRNGTSDVYFHRLRVGERAEFIEVR